MMTTHELARRLLAGADVPVVVREPGDGLWSPSSVVFREVVWPFPIVVGSIP
jgi:hypothetical protein